MRSRSISALSRKVPSNDDGQVNDTLLRRGHTYLADAEELPCPICRSLSARRVAVRHDEGAPIIEACSVAREHDRKAPVEQGLSDLLADAGHTVAVEHLHPRDPLSHPLDPKRTLQKSVELCSLGAIKAPVAEAEVGNGDACEREALQGHLGKGLEEAPLRLGGRIGPTKGFRGAANCPAEGPRIRSVALKQCVPLGQDEGPKGNLVRRRPACVDEASLPRRGQALEARMKQSP